MLILFESWLVWYIKRSDVMVYNFVGLLYVFLMLNIWIFLNKKYFECYFNKFKLIMILNVIFEVCDIVLL